MKGIGMDDETVSDLANSLNCTIDRIADAICDNPDDGTVTHAIRGGLRGISHAITANASAGTDEVGGTVTSLTEAVMGMTKALCQIATALESIAEAIRDK